MIVKCGTVGEMVKELSKFTNETKVLTLMRGSVVPLKVVSYDEDGPNEPVFIVIEPDRV